MKKSILILFLFFVGMSQLFSQDLFELKFSDANGTQYKGLLVIFNESKMYMRVAYVAENMYKVVNVEYSSEHGTYDGVEYLALVGSNPRFITAAGQFGYNPDHLIFTDVLDTPIVTDDPNDAGRTSVADSFRPLSSLDITDTYLREFYANNEHDYKALKRMFNIGGSKPKPKPIPDNNNHYGNSATLHLVVIANTAIGDIGSGCLVDQRNLESEFKGISNTLGIPFRKYIVNGDGFTKSNALNTLNNLSVGKNDIVICVYRGHGFRWSNQTELWPQLDMRTSSYMRLSENTSMSLKDVYDKVVAKGARLNIVLGDCCNNDIGISQLTENNFLSMQNNNNYDLGKLRQLFMRSEGNMLSCSASPGEFSWVNTANGGFFTVSFLQSLREEISYLKNDQADWGDLMNNTIRSARAKTDSCTNCTPQNGKYYDGTKSK